MTVIVILALVALFIGLRLYSVLGERTGHEQQQPILKPADPDALVEPRVAQPTINAPSALDAGDMAFLPTAGPGVRAILAADPNFDVGHFLEGAKSAYRMILEAYWKGDTATMTPHVDAHVAEAFAGAAAEREKEGLTLDNRLVAIEQALIAEAALDGSVATVTVRFEATSPRPAQGRRSCRRIAQLRVNARPVDFRRDINCVNPNWLLSKPTRKSEGLGSSPRARFLLSALALRPQTPPSEPRRMVFHCRRKPFRRRLSPIRSLPTRADRLRWSVRRPTSTAPMRPARGDSAFLAARWHRPADTVRSGRRRRGPSSRGAAALPTTSASFLYHRLTGSASAPDRLEPLLRAR